MYMCIHVYDNFMINMYDANAWSTYKTYAKLCDTCVITVMIKQYDDNTYDNSHDNTYDKHAWQNLW